MKPILGSETLYLVGFRIDPDLHNPQMYTLYIDEDRPITRQGQPLLFTRPNLADAALKESDCCSVLLKPAPHDVYAVFDIAGALYIFESKDEAPDGTALDCINAMLDFLALIEDVIPSGYRSIMEKLADHLTFNREFSDFLHEQSISRKDIVDAFFWCIGAIVCRTKILS